MIANRSFRFLRLHLANKIMLLIVLLGFALRVYRLEFQSFWYDEILTVFTTAVLSMSEMLDIVIFGERNHMPLYFLVMQSWSDIGTSEFVIRFFSVIWGTISIPLIYSLGRFIGGRIVGLVAGFLLAVTPFHIWYSQEARMYSLAPALVIVVHWFLFRAVRFDRGLDWIGYAISMLIAVYTHYFALLILAAHYVFFAFHYGRIKNKFFRWLLAAGAVTVLFGIWGIYIVLLGGFSEAPISWISTAGWSEPIFTILSFAVGPAVNPQNVIFYAVPTIYLAAIGVCFIVIARRKNSATELLESDAYWASRLLLIWLIVPLAITFFISFNWSVPGQRSIYVDRYLIIILPAVLLCAAWGIVTLIRRTNKPWILPATLTIISIIIALSLYRMYHASQYARPDWRHALSWLIEESDSGDVILGSPLELPPIFYYTDQEVPFIVLPNTDSAPESKERFEIAMADQISALAEDRDRAWLITHYFNNDAHGFAQKRNRQLQRADQDNSHKVWMDSNYETFGEWTFTGIKLTLYDLSSLPNSEDQ